jgi:carbon storage regulator CsrA
MLVLTRKQADTICIGDDIVVKVIQTGRGNIKLGIDAPRHVRVLRGEVVDEAAQARLVTHPISTSRPFVHPVPQIELNFRGAV